MLLLPDHSLETGLKFVGDWGRHVFGASWGPQSQSRGEGCVALCSWASYSEARPLLWSDSPGGPHGPPGGDDGPQPHGAGSPMAQAAAPGETAGQGVGPSSGLCSHAVLLGSPARSVHLSRLTVSSGRSVCEALSEEVDVLHKPGGCGAAVAGSGLSPPCQTPGESPCSGLSLGALGSGMWRGFLLDPGAVLPHRKPGEESSLRRLHGSLCG